MISLRIILTQVDDDDDDDDDCGEQYLLDHFQKNSDSQLKPNSQGVTFPSL